MKRILTILMATAAIQVPVLAQTAAKGAQESGGSGVGLVDIVVTAQKREESLQDTPISISALDAGALETKRIVSLSDLGSAVPMAMFGEPRSTGVDLSMKF